MVIYSGCFLSHLHVYNGQYKEFQRLTFFLGYKGGLCECQLQRRGKWWLVFHLNACKGKRYTF